MTSTRKTSSEILSGLQIDHSLQPEWDWSEPFPNVHYVIADGHTCYVITTEYALHDGGHYHIARAFPSNIPTWDWHNYVPAYHHDYLPATECALGNIIHHAQNNGCLQFIAQSIPNTSEFIGHGWEGIMIGPRSLRPICTSKSILDVMGAVELRHDLIYRLDSDMNVGLSEFIPLTKHPKPRS